jgi:hypothetical protein
MVLGLIILTMLFSLENRVRKLDSSHLISQK